MFGNQCQTDPLPGDVPTVLKATLALAPLPLCHLQKEHSPGHFPCSQRLSVLSWAVELSFKERHDVEFSFIPAKVNGETSVRERVETVLFPLVVIRREKMPRLLLFLAILSLCLLPLPRLFSSISPRSCLPSLYSILPLPSYAPPAIVGTLRSSWPGVSGLPTMAQEEVLGKHT